MNLAGYGEFSWKFFSSIAFSTTEHLDSNEYFCVYVTAVALSLLISKLNKSAVKLER